MLETVGVGAGAELVDGAGAGAELGGASLVDLDGAGAAFWLALAATWAPAWGAGAAAWALADARTRLGWALADAELAGGEVFAADAAVVSLAVVWAGTLRANKVAKPTAVTALSWAARQVRRERRRRPAERAAPGGSSGYSYVSRMTGDHSRARVKSS